MEWSAANGRGAGRARVLMAAAVVSAAAMLAIPAAPAHAAPAAGTAAAAADTAPSRRIGILAGRVIDGKSGTPRGRSAILVEGDRIVSIGPPESLPPGTEILDLGSATVLPGLIDMHSHPLQSTDSYQVDHLRWSSAYKALKGLRAVQDNLMHGWTTLRVCGDADVYYANQDIRRAIQEGLHAGPRITGAAHYISVTGGGGDMNFIAPEHHLVADGLVVDGADAIRKAVREEIKHGSDWIKLLVTGAFMSVGDNPRHVHFSPEELRAAVEEAARRDVPVMAHAHAAEGIKMAIRAGVRTIEHGTFMDDEAIRMMVQRGVYLTPTISVGDYYEERGSDSPEMQKNVELSRQEQKAFYARVEKAIRAGVKIVLGSDWGGFDPVLNAREFRSLVRAGMTPMQAIQAGTRVAAEALRWDDRVGTLEPGKLADIIAVAGDPLQDITELERVSFVMIGGKVVRRP